MVGSINKRLTIDIMKAHSFRFIRRLTGRFLSGFCHNCERNSEWIERDLYYRCSACGRDPMMNKPE